MIREKIQKSPYKKGNPKKPGSIKNHAYRRAFENAQGLLGIFILSEPCATKQESNTKISFSSHNLHEITLLIEERRLTECLELLEKHGYMGDAAILILGYLQGQGGAA